MSELGRQAYEETKQTIQDLLLKLKDLRLQPRTPEVNEQIEETADELRSQVLFLNEMVLERAHV